MAQKCNGIPLLFKGRPAKQRPTLDVHLERSLLWHDST